MINHIAYYIMLLWGLALNQKRIISFYGMTETIYLLYIQNWMTIQAIIKQHWLQTKYWEPGLHYHPEYPHPQCHPDYLRCLHHPELEIINWFLRMQVSLGWVVLGSIRGWVQPFQAKKPLRLKWLKSLVFWIEFSVFSLDETSTQLAKNKK